MYLHYRDDQDLFATAINNNLLDAFLQNLGKRGLWYEVHNQMNTKY